ncbi:MAG TPA: hydroxysqualene dehydroxylase HpnE [Stellaceae bacterium]
MSGEAQPPGRVHVVGAGMAGLAVAVVLAERGCAVRLYESGQHAGGRCRSFFDAELGCRIDNGNHLLLSGNEAAISYIERIGAVETFERPDEAAVPFVDLATGERWAVRPSRGRLPWWIFAKARRVPGTRAGEYLEALKLRRAPPEARVAEVLDPAGALFRRLWEPVAVAALNTGARDGSARLFWRILAETLGRGAAACKPLVPLEGLSESLVDPALATLRRRGAEIRFGARLRALGFAGARVAELGFDDGPVALRPEDEVVLAVPAAIAARLVPELVVPDDYAPIVNAHFRCVVPANAPLFLGIVGGAAEWVFRKREVVSVTVSAADRLVERPADELRDLLWQDVAVALDLPPRPVPPARIVKERRATFRATPAQSRRRPATATRWPNLRLAGDYVDTDLPATIEGAIRSGIAAAAGIGRNRGAAPAPNLAALDEPSSPTIEERRRALP